MITIRFKNKKGKNNYNNNEVNLLKEIIQQDLYYMMTEVCEEKCENCKYKRLCDDIERVLLYLNSPNNSN